MPQHQNKVSNLSAFTAFQRLESGYSHSRPVGQFFLRKVRLNPEPAQLAAKLFEVLGRRKIHINS